LWAMQAATRRGVCGCGAGDEQSGVRAVGAVQQVAAEGSAAEEACGRPRRGGSLCAGLESVGECGVAAACSGGADGLGQGAA